MKLDTPTGLITVYAEHGSGRCKRVTRFNQAQSIEIRLLLSCCYSSRMLCPLLTIKMERVLLPIVMSLDEWIGFLHAWKLAPDQYLFSAGRVSS